MDDDSGFADLPANRRQVLATLPAMCALAGCSGLLDGDPTEADHGFHNGLKIGEVTPESAVVWSRLSWRRNASRRNQAYRYPPATGTVQLAVWPAADPGQFETVEQQDVTRSEDATATFHLTGLDPGTEYRVFLVGAPDEAEEGVAVEGGFRTAPDPSAPAPVSFAVVTCQAWRFRDAGEDGQAGFRVYETLDGMGPDFFVHTGDIVYYDQGRLRGRSVRNAREHWRRTYSLPLLREFHNETPSYFLKDDHDIIEDDAWPGQQYGNLSFAEGIEIFNEHNPTGEVPYSTVRWGSDLQIWLLEMREFRTPNTVPDGPEKTMLGEEQLDWLLRTVRASDAAFRVVIAPTIFVGPDRSNKNDNYANRGFQREGQMLRKFLADQDVLVIGGDRHWQYVSVDGDTGLWEFGCGPLADGREGGWKADDRHPEHRFLAIEPGFAWATIDRENGEPILTIEHRTRHGDVRHSQRFAADPLEAL